MVVAEAAFEVVEVSDFEELDVGDDDNVPDRVLEKEGLAVRVGEFDPVAAIDGVFEAELEREIELVAVFDGVAWQTGSFTQ